MNPMIAALQNSRSVSPVGPSPADAAPAGPGDALLDKLASIEAKIDKICAAMNMDGNSRNEAGEKDATEATPNDDGY